VTPENEFAKRQLRYSTCFTAGFSGSPIGCPITFFSAHHIPVHKAANILMWSHYGDRHKGICLGFDVADELTRPVEYVADVLVLGNLMVQKRSEFSEDQGITILDRMFGFKYDGWSYEQEVREHATRAEKDEETGHYFVDFSGRLKLKEVIAGVRFPMTRKPIDDALKDYSEDVKVVKGRRSPTRFEIIIDKSEW
jgi:hypothetical protein